MPNSVMTAAGLKLFADALQNHTTITIDQFVFADVPDLDATQTPDENQGLPEEAQIKLRAEVEASGRVDDNTVVYSKTLAADVGDWYLNWIGLYSTVHKQLIAVCYVPRHYKYATKGFEAGNTLYKNFAIQYANAAALTGIEIDAATWQVDFDSRYERLGSVAKHDANPDAHPGTFDKAGTGASEAKKAVDAHNKDSNAHPGTFDKAGTADEKVNTHNTDPQAHKDLFAKKAELKHTHQQSDVSGLESALNGKAAKNHNHDGTYEKVGVAEQKVSEHDQNKNAHNGTFDKAGTANSAVSEHDANQSAHSALFAKKSDTSHNHDQTYSKLDHNHNGTYDPAGTAQNLVDEHNKAQDAHNGLFAKADASNITEEAAGNLAKWLEKFGVKLEAKQEATTNLGASYAKLPGGLILMFGHIIPGTSGPEINEGNWNVYRQSWPIAWPNGPIALVATRKHPNLEERTQDELLKFPKFNDDGISEDDSVLTHYTKEHYYIQCRRNAYRRLTWIAIGH